MLRVGIIGRGAIGGTVARILEQDPEAGCVLSGVITRDSSPGEFRSVVSGSDLVVEAAGHAGLAAHGPAVIEAGVDLLVVSVGALVDDALLDELRSHGGGGRLLLSTGAIGGLDLLRAAALLGPLTEVGLHTTKRPEVLVRPWMDRDLVRRLEAGEEVTEAFRGTAREAARRFPESANVAATLGLATIGLDATRVTVLADPRAGNVRHAIRAHGVAGTYEITIENSPSERNPRTSAITPFAVVRALRDHSGRLVAGA